MPYRYLAYPAADEVVPDPRYAYLIVDSRELPEREDQQTSIHIRKFGGGVHHLEAGIPMYAIVPERYEVTRVHFTHSSEADEDTRFFRRRIRLKAKPGVVYYFGTAEIASRDGSYSIRIVRDEDLYRRACLYAPAVLAAFPLEFIGDSDGELPFPACDKAAPPARDYASGSGR
jgi:hypothetical protein